MRLTKKRMTKHSMTKRGWWSRAPMISLFLGSWILATGSDFWMMMVKDDLRCLIQHCKIDNEIEQIHGRGNFFCHFFFFSLGIFFFFFFLQNINTKFKKKKSTKHFNCLPKFHPEKRTKKKKKTRRLMNLSFFFIDRLMNLFGSQ